MNTRMHIPVLAAVISMCACTYTDAQESTFLEEYRNRVLEYSHEIKAAEHYASAKAEREKTAKAEFLPSLRGYADASYTGNPKQLSVSVPGHEEPLTFRGSHLGYGATLTLSQPVYSGGAIKAGYDIAVLESLNAGQRTLMTVNDIIYSAEIYYWNAVACEETERVAEEFRKSVFSLVETIEDRVKEGYTDRNDLLMAQVKLNEAEYMVLQASNDARIARMMMNSFSGVPADTVMRTDSEVIPIRKAETDAMDADSIVMNRPEMHIARNTVDLRKSEARLEESEYLPKFSIGLDGSMSSPGYDFTPDISPNYAVYARLSVPIFEWGKLGNARRAGSHNVGTAEEELDRTLDDLRLEIETAVCNYSQAVEKVKLSESSLDKARENELLTTDKYLEGEVSIIEVINAQIYHHDARVKYIQSKLDAQTAKSSLDRATGRNCSFTENGNGKVRTQQISD